MTVSFIIVAYNAEKYLGDLLSDLQAQTFPKEQLELLLVDSASTDKTLSIMSTFAATAAFPVRILSNPKRWLAAGINVALREAAGDTVIRLDAHARIPSDFLENSVRALTPDRDIVGGCVLGAQPHTPWESVLRALDTSRFGGGAAPFRNAGSAREVDTLAYALYRKTVYDQVGFYDERLRRTEDNDMHYRMHKAGYHFYFSPEIVSYHTARTTLRGQLRQKWGNGYWIGRTIHFQPGCFAPRHLIPAAFVLAILACLLLLSVSSLPLRGLCCAYLLCDLFYAVKGALREKQGRLLSSLTLPFLFPCMHIVYGAGTLFGLLTPEKKVT